MLEPLPGRRPEQHVKRENQHQHAQAQPHVHHKQHDGIRHDQSVHQTHRRIKQEPFALAGHIHWRARRMAAQQVAVGQKEPVLLGLLVEVRNVQRIGQHVVRVKAQQGVAVEQQARDRANQHHVKGQAVDQARTGGCPHQRTHPGHEQIGQHARRTHQHAVALVGKGPGGRGVHIRQRRGHQKHQAKSVNAAAIALADQAVAHLVNHLHHGHTQVKPR